MNSPINIKCNKYMAKARFRALLKARPKFRAKAKTMAKSKVRARAPWSKVKAKAKV